MQVWNNLCKKLLYVLTYNKIESDIRNVSNEVSNENKIDEKNNKESANNLDENGDDNEEYDNIEIVNVEWSRGG